MMKIWRTSSEVILKMIYLKFQLFLLKKTFNIINIIWLNKLNS